MVQCIECSRYVSSRDAIGREMEQKGWRICNLKDDAESRSTYKSATFKRECAHHDPIDEVSKARRWAFLAKADRKVVNMIKKLQTGEKRVA